MGRTEPVIPTDPAGELTRRVRALGGRTAEADIRTAWHEVLLAELELRAGRRLAADLTDEQVDEFAEIADAGEGAAWLAARLPSYREVVAEEIEELISAAAVWFTSQEHPGEGR